jgi:hypothetical protein
MEFGFPAGWISRIEEKLLRCNANSHASITCLRSTSSFIWDTSGSSSAIRSRKLPFSLI